MQTNGINNTADIAERLKSEVSKTVFGQEDIIKLLIVCLFAGGHVLIEGVPGLGKTLAVRTLAAACELDFSRIQFTSDLMPSDVIGASIYNFDSRQFVLKKGPVFTNFLLADEINRTPPKTQSALLEAMEEGRVSIDGEGIELPHPFMVCATQNPIEFEGTYPLPEAQLDRFMMKLIINYPEREAEEAMIKNYLSGFNTNNFGSVNILKAAGAEEISKCRKEAAGVGIEESVARYMLDIVSATRNTPYLSFGASPRASVAFLQAARVLAFFDGRTYITPEDIQYLAYPVLRHRIILTPDAVMDGMDPDLVISQVLSRVNVPRRVSQ